MKSTRRNVIRGATAALGTGVVMAACAPGGGAGDKIAQGQSAREVTIRWSTWDVSTGGFTAEAAHKGIKLFNEKFPKIKIVAEGQDGDWQTKNKTEWIAGTGADMSGHCCTVGVQWAREGLFTDLDAKMKKDIPSKIREDYV